MMMNSPSIFFLIWPWQIRHQIHWIPSIPSNYPCPLEKSCLMSIHVKKQAGTVNVTLWLCQNSYWTCTIEIVDLPIQNGDVPSFFLGLPGRVNHPFRWLQLPTVGEISTSLSVFTGFMHQKKDMSNITEISKKNIQLGTFHLVAEFW
jgi:hypothetical protein